MQDKKNKAKAQKMFVPISTNIKRLKMYLPTFKAAQRLLFETLLIGYNFNHAPYYHSISDLADEIGASPTGVKNMLKEFKRMGFYSKVTGGRKNITHHSIDYHILARTITLEKIYQEEFIAKVQPWYSYNAAMQTVGSIDEQLDQLGISETDINHLYSLMGNFEETLSDFLIQYEIELKHYLQLFEFVKWCRGATIDDYDLPLKAFDSYMNAVENKEEFPKDVISYFLTINDKTGGYPIFEKYEYEFAV